MIFFLDFTLPGKVYHNLFIVCFQSCYHTSHFISYLFSPQSFCCFCPPYFLFSVVLLFSNIYYYFTLCDCFPLPLSSCSISSSFTPILHLSPPFSYSHWNSLSSLLSFIFKSLSFFLFLSIYRWGLN